MSGKAAKLLYNRKLRSGYVAEFKDSTYLVAELEAIRDDPEARMKWHDKTRDYYQWMSEFRNVRRWLHDEINTIDRDTKQVKISFISIPIKYRAWEVKPGYPVFLVSTAEEIVHYITKPCRVKKGGWFEKRGFKWTVQAETE